MAKWKIVPTQAMRSMVAEKGADKKHFQLMVEFEEEGNQWCIVEIEGAPAPGYEDDEKDEKPQKGKVVETFMNAMKGSQSSTDTGDNGYGAT